MGAPLSNDFTGAHDGRAVEIHPGGLWSLWDVMINFGAFGLVKAIDSLKSLHEEYEGRSSYVNYELKKGSSYTDIVNSEIGHEVSDADARKILELLKFVESEAHTLGMQGVMYRISMFRQAAQRRGISINEVATELKILRQTVESDLNKV
ncbi:MAG: hypothetical protein ABSG83_19435, partial [Roseiarcus sp.]